jgi:hypothetical protein
MKEGRNKKKGYGLDYVSIDILKCGFGKGISNETKLIHSM